MEWRECWRDPILTDPRERQDVIVLLTQGGVIKAKFKDGRYQIVRRNEIVYIDVIGWIPLPNKLPPSENPEMPLEVVFPYMAKENGQLKWQLGKLEHKAKENEELKAKVAELAAEKKALIDRVNELIEQGGLGRPVKSIVKQVRAFVTQVTAQLDKLDGKDDEPMTEGSIPMDEEVIDLDNEEMF